MSEFKNKWLYVAAAMLGGLIIAGIGWDKYESTIPERTNGSVVMMVIGLIMFFGAVGYLAINTNGRK